MLPGIGYEASLCIFSTETFPGFTTAKTGLRNCICRYTVGKNGKEFQNHAGSTETKLGLRGIIDPLCRANHGRRFAIDTSERRFRQGETVRPRDSFIANSLTCSIQISAKRLRWKLAGGA